MRTSSADRADRAGAAELRSGRAGPDHGQGHGQPGRRRQRSRPTTTGEGSRAVVQPRPLKILFVPVAADDEGSRRCPDVRDVAAGHRGVPDGRVAGRPGDAQHGRGLLGADRASRRADRGRPDGAAAMLMSRIDRLKFSAAGVDKVVGVVPEGWFSRQLIDGFAEAVGIAPLGGGARRRDRRAPEHGRLGRRARARAQPRLDRGRRARTTCTSTTSPRRATGSPQRRDIPASTLDIMQFNTAGADVREPHRALDVQEDVGLPHDEARPTGVMPGPGVGRLAVGQRLGLADGRGEGRPGAYELPGDARAEEGSAR